MGKAKHKRFRPVPCAGCGKLLWPPEAGDTVRVVYARTARGGALCIVCWANGGRPPKSHRGGDADDMDEGLAAADDTL